MKISIPITDPTTREGGGALDPSKELAFVNILMSADNGQNYASVGHAAPGQPTFEQELTDPGTYLFKADAEDLQTPALDSKDSNVVSFTVPAPALAAPSPPTLGTPVAV